MDESLQDAARRLCAGPMARGLKPQAVHLYKDQAGELLHAVIRLKHPGTGEKWIRPVHRIERGYDVGEPHYPDGKPIYHLDAIAGQPGAAVYVCEGELCCDKLAKVGVIATTSCGGAQSALKADWSPLRGRAVTVWPDNDEAGQYYAEAVAKILLTLGCTVRIVDVAALALPSAGDVVDWLAANPGATAADVRALSTIDAGYLPRTGSAFSSPASGPAWDIPKPIEAPLPPVAPFDPALLPDPMRAWVMDEADRMPCPPDFVAAAAIVALGAVVGARCGIKPKAHDHWLIVPNLWGGIVGPPSAKKSPAVAVALKPLARLDARAREIHEAERRGFVKDEMVFKAKRDALEAQMKAAAKNPDNGDLDRLAQAVEQHCGEAPEPPVLRRYKSNDSTVEKLGELLRDNPAGMFVFRDELVGLLTSWERDGREGDRAFYLEAWNGTGSFDTDRIGRGSISIPNLCLSVFGGIQPDKLTGFLAQAARSLANDGMLQRFQVLVYPDHTPWVWRDREPDKNAQQAAVAVFEKLAEFSPVDFGAHAADENAKVAYFHFDEEAQARYIEWAGILHGEMLQGEDSPIIAQHLAKFDKLVPALALIFHLVECAASGASGPIGKSAVTLAIGWCAYLETHARRCYGLLTDDGLRSAKALADKLREGKLKDGFTGRDVRRNQWRFLTNANDVEAALGWLVDDSWLRACHETAEGGIGRSTIRYLINPQVKKVGKGDSPADLFR